MNRSRSAALFALLFFSLALLPAPAARAQQGNELTLPVNAGLVSTSATAHRRIPNTVADVSVGIQTQGADAPSVSRDLAQRSQTLLDWLRGQGAERLATDQISFQPQTHEEKNGQQKIVGYTGSTTVSFRTTPEKVGAILSGVLDHGANTIQQTSYAPKEEDEDKVRKELAQEATRTAMAQGEAVANAAGTHVIGVREVNVEPSGIMRPMPMMRMSMGAATKEIPMAGEAGDQDISVTVSVKLTVSR
ncbi:MAG: SIMPL domain-containing protein [Acidobacteriaceae bacterium]